MNAPPSPHFTPVDLGAAFNCKRAELPAELDPAPIVRERYGGAQARGIPFRLGPENAHNAILLDKEPVTVDAGGRKATYIVFLHVVEDVKANYLDGLEMTRHDAAGSGDHVSDYVIEYDNGASETRPILRRFAIQQGVLAWGSSGFACVPANSDVVISSNYESFELGRLPDRYGPGEVRTSSGRDQSACCTCWLYALPNPAPDRPIHRIHLQPRDERSVVYGVSLTELPDHPLRYQPRHKLLLTLPGGVELNAAGEIADIDIDLGTVISARARQVYDASAWDLGHTDVQPDISQTEVVVEYTAHPAARLHVGRPEGDPVVYDLASPTAQTVTIAPAHRPVTIKVIDKTTRNPVGVRIHLHGEAGEYLPPKGYHRKVNGEWFQDNYGEFRNGANQYAYIRGECIADLPLGTVYVEITRGYEVTPIRKAMTISPDTGELTFVLDRVLDWRNDGWVTADTHVHFLTPTTAVLEGEAEDVNVVNLLASQWGEMFSNTSDFDGSTSHSNTLPGNNGEFLCRVGSENRMQHLGHISLLGYSGELIHPLCSGGPSESALGDFQEVTMADWARRCRRQNGFVVMPHAPNPQLERVADVVLDLVDAIEFMTFNPYDFQLRPSAVADWYRFLNTGYHLPLTGGSDKMAASSLLGGVRTYTQLGDRPFTYENWMAATRQGHTFVTVGPLVDMRVEGQPPGATIELPENGGTVTVAWRAESVRLPIQAVEVVVGGKTHSEGRFDNVFEAEGSTEVAIDDSTWIAIRVRGNYSEIPESSIAAHTSAVRILAGDKPLYRHEDAVDMLRQIEGAIAYIDTIASRPDADRYLKMKHTLESAYDRLHQKMHREGQYHHHSPLHDHGHEH